MPEKVCATDDDETEATNHVFACDPMNDGIPDGDSKDYCTFFTPDPGASDLYLPLFQCKSTSDCPKTTEQPLAKCFANVWMPCNKCVAATWKLLTRTDATDPKVHGLFDLRSNPGEEERLNFKYQNCDQDVEPPAVAVEILGGSWTGDSEEDRIKTVMKQLRSGQGGLPNRNLQNWIDCADNDGCSGDPPF